VSQGVKGLLEEEASKVVASKTTGHIKKKGFRDGRSSKDIGAKGEKNGRTVHS